MEKIKVYLDTNTILDFFINQALAFRGKKPFTMPSKLEFFVGNLEKMEFVTSFYTKAEVMREMVAGYGMNKDKVEGVWNDLMKLLNCDYVAEFTFNQYLVEVAGNLRLRLRTLINFQHLVIAISRGVYLVTGDEDLIEKARENKIYDKILSYIELRKLIASLS
jgi:predicted nucleic acid-binding protein